MWFMTKDDMKWLIGICVGLILGASGAYATITTNDAVLNTRVAQVEAASKQHQCDINTLRVEVSKTKTEVKNTDESYKALRATLKDVATSMRDLSGAIVRLQEGQKNSNKVIESLTTKIEKMYEGKK